MRLELVYKKDMQKYLYDEDTGELYASQAFIDKANEAIGCSPYLLIREPQQFLFEPVHTNTVVCEGLFFYAFGGRTSCHSEYEVGIFEDRDTNATARMMRLYIADSWIGQLIEVSNETV